MSEKWILLTKDAGSHPLGPFSEEEVCQQLQVGKIQLEDCAWKKGLQTWVPLKNIRNFNPEIIHSLIDNSSADEHFDILSSIKTYELNPAFLKWDFLEEINTHPKEAKTENLVPMGENWQEISSPERILKRKQKSVCEAVQIAVPKATARYLLDKNGYAFFRRQRAWKKWALILLLLLLVGMLYDFIL